MYNPKRVTITFEISTSPEMTCEQLAEMIEGTTEQVVTLISEKFLARPDSQNTTTSATVDVQVAEME